MRVTLSLTLALLLYSSATHGNGNFSARLAEAALQRTQYSITYDGSYQAISYPGGDVDASIGVCTDVIIRSYRSLGVDLQQLVHEDIRVNFELYPSAKLWGHTRPDTNIDHRRVPNLQVFFSRHGENLPITDNAKDYLAGDVVSWMLPGNLPHIGIVSSKKNAHGRPLVIHNIGSGPELDDSLFRFTLTGHYRYLPTISELN